MAKNSLHFYCKRLHFKNTTKWNILLHKDMFNIIFVDVNFCPQE